MSESKEHKRRYNMKLIYIAKFEKWVKEEPPIILYWKWRKWLKERPVWKE